MAFHESHERFCPHCKERMSATAPKCLNCGRFVDEPDEDDDEAEARARKVWFVGLAVALAAIALVLVLIVG